MTSQMNAVALEETVCTPIVKNTFITLKSADVVTTRSMSVPASSRLCLGGKDINFPEDFSDSGRPQADSEVSTDVCTECSYDELESGYRTPLLSDDEDSLTGRSAPASPLQIQKPFGDTRRSNGVEPPPTPLLSTRPRPLARLSSKAAAFKPLALKEEVVHQYDHQFSRVIKNAVKMMRESDSISNIEVSDNLRDCAIIIQTSSDSAVTDSVLELAHHALMDAASQSKCIFLMGYCAPKPFIMCPSGFEVTLGAMESATSACWHVFKKGFCRHGDDCCKQHPTCKIPVRIIVETSQLKAPDSKGRAPVEASANSIMDFNLQSADFITSVLATLKENPHFAKVGASRSKTSKSWTIELTPRDNADQYNDYLLTMAKNAFYSTSASSDALYLLGYAAKPFSDVPNGFVAVLGNMMAETRACWDFYSKGVCFKGCDCRWEHPNCMVPVRVVVARA